MKNTVHNGFVHSGTTTGFLRSFNDVSTSETIQSLPAQKKDLEDASARKMGTATRRLCAGAYLNRDFRQELLCDIYNSRKRRAAPSYGYDLVHVLRHAWRAWWIELIRDTIAVALFIIALVIAPLGVLLTIGLIATWYSVRACWRVLIEAARVLRQRKAPDYARYAHYAQGLWSQAKLAASKLLGSAIVVTGAILAMRFYPQRSRLRHDLVQIGHLAALLISLFLVASIAVQWQLDRLHDPLSVKGQPRSRRLRTLDTQQHHIVTVYSRFNPFVGSGSPVYHWSFAQRLIPQDARNGWDRTPALSGPPFTTAEIVKHLKQSIKRLASTKHAETRLPGLTVRDHIFIDGRYVNKVPDVLSDQPSQDTLDNILTKPREEARYHIACQVEAWDGELVTTVFVHISLQGETLYVEFSAFALYPTPRRFHIIDKVGGAGLKAALQMAGRSLSQLPDMTLNAPRRLAVAPKHLLRAYWSQWEPKTREFRRYDIGARISAREIAEDYADSNRDEDSASKRNREKTSYFQLLDVARHSKIIERCLLAAIEEFLKSKGVDTSEFVQRALAILNQNFDLRGSQGAQLGNYNTQSNSFNPAPGQTGGSAVPGTGGNPSSTAPVPPSNSTTTGKSA